MTIIESHKFYLTDDKKNFIHFEVLRNVLPKTTVFIHGNLSSNRWWYPSLDFAKLKTNPTLLGDVVMVEIRGCGKSSTVESAEIITIESLASEIKSFLLSLKLESLNLVGHSTGGSIATILAAELPLLIGKVLLLDPVGPRGRRFEPAVMQAFESMKTDKELVAEVMKTTIRAPNINTRFFSNVVVPDAFRAAQNIGYKIAQAFGEFNIESKLAFIKSAVLILHGEQDQILTYQGSIDMAEKIRGARCEILADKGHCANLEDPSLFWTKTMEFLFPAKD